MGLFILRKEFWRRSCRRISFLWYNGYSRKGRFTSGRMKTGTPPRVDGRSLNFDIMEEQPGDEQPGTFSYSKRTSPLKQQRSCHMTYTSEEVHTITYRLDRSHVQWQYSKYRTKILSSIEDKINRFADKNRYQIFVEPEGWNTIEYYINGFSTSSSRCPV